MRRAAKWLGVALGGLLIVIAAVGAWSLHTQTGARWIGLPASGGGLLKLGTATLSVLGFEHGRPAIASWNAD